MICMYNDLFLSSSCKIYPVCCCHTKSYLCRLSWGTTLFFHFLSFFYFLVFSCTFTALDFNYICLNRIFLPFHPRLFLAYFYSWYYFFPLTALNIICSPFTYNFSSVLKMSSAFSFYTFSHFLVIPPLKIFSLQFLFISFFPLVIPAPKSSFHLMRLSSHPLFHPLHASSSLLLHSSALSFNFLHSSVPSIPSSLIFSS